MQDHQVNAIEYFNEGWSDQLNLLSCNPLINVTVRVIELIN